MKSHTYGLHGLLGGLKVPCGFLRRKLGGRGALRGGAQAATAPRAERARPLLHALHLLCRHRPRSISLMLLLMLLQKSGCESH